MNIVELHEKIANEWIKKILEKEKDNIVGIVALGSIGRGFGDKMSDIDITVFIKEGKERVGEEFVKISEEDKKKYGISRDEIGIDYEFTLYEKALKREWDLGAKWAYSKSKILYDPEGKIKELLEKKAKLTEEEKKEIMMEGFVQSKYYTISVPNKLVKRGDIIAAHYSMFYGIDYLLNCIYILNDEIPPALPWKFFWLKFLKKVPENFMEDLKEALIIKELTEEDLRRRQGAFSRIWIELLYDVERKLGISYKEMEEVV